MNNETYDFGNLQVRIVRNLAELEASMGVTAGSFKDEYPFPLFLWHDEVGGHYFANVITRDDLVRALLRLEMVRLEEQPA